MLHIYIQVRHVPYGARPGFIVCLIMTHTIVSSISIDATSLVYFPTQTSLHERNILEKEGNQQIKFRMQRTNSHLASVGENNEQVELFIMIVIQIIERSFKFSGFVKRILTLIKSIQVLDEILK